MAKNLHRYVVEDGRRTELKKWLEKKILLSKKVCVIVFILTLSINAHCFVIQFANSLFVLILENVVENYYYHRESKLI